MKLANLFFFLLLSFTTAPVFAEDTVRFHNASNHPVLVAFVYSKDGSIAGLGSSGYDDPEPFTYTHGYITLAPKSYHDIPRRKGVSVYNKTLTAGLAGVRAIVTSGGEQSILHPNRGGPEYYAIWSKPGKSNFYWTITSASQSGIDRKVQDLARRGENVSVGMFYSLYHWENTNSDGGKWHGVGGSGSKSLDVINDFWAANAKDEGTVFKFRNGSSTKYEYRVSFETTDGQWHTFTNTVDAQPNATFSFSTSADKPIVNVGVGRYNIKVEGKDFDGRTITWGPPVNAGVSETLYNGERRLVLDMTLN